MYEKIINHDQFEFIPGIQGWLNIRKFSKYLYYIDRLKKKTHIIISKESYKQLENSTPTLDKNSKQKK